MLPQKPLRDSSAYAIELRFDPDKQEWWIRADPFIAELRGIEDEATRRADEEEEKHEDRDAWMHLNTMASTARQLADGLSLALAEASTDLEEDLRQHPEETEDE